MNRGTFWDSVLDKIWLEEITLFTVYFFKAKVKDILSKVKPISELRKIDNDQKISLQTNEAINWLNLIQIVPFNLLIKVKQMENLEHPMIVSFQSKQGLKDKSLDFAKLTSPLSLKYPDILKICNEKDGWRNLKTKTKKNKNLYNILFLCNFFQKSETMATANPTDKSTFHKVSDSMAEKVANLTRTFQAMERSSQESSAPKEKPKSELIKTVAKGK